MKILHVFDHSIPLHSGYTFRSHAILREQRARGWETAHITGGKHGQSLGGAWSSGGEGSGAAVEEVDGLRFHRTPPPSGVLSKLPVLNQWLIVRDLERRLEQAVAAERPDILHAHSPALNGEAALRVARRHGLPLVYEIRAFWEDAAVDHGSTTEGGLRYRLTRALETRVVRGADAVCVICEGLRGDILGRGIPAEKVTVIPNAVDLEHFDPDPARDPALVEELGLTGRTVLGFIGSFYAYEGLPLAIDALALLAAERDDLRLLLVGGGPQEGAIRAASERHGLADKVVFTGRVPHSEVGRYYALVDAFLYPRLPMRLTDLVTPLKPLEAMAQQRLVVASDVGGHRELIRDGETGWLFRAGDAADLARAVRELLAAQERWPAVKAAGRAYVEHERNWAASVANYAPVYERLAGRRG